MDLRKGNNNSHGSRNFYVRWNVSHGSSKMGTYSTNDLTDWMLKNLSKWGDISNLTFEDIGIIHSGNFTIGNKQCPVKMDEWGSKYIKISGKKYYDYNDIKDDPIRSEHVYRATKLTLFIWDKISETWWYDGIYMIIRDNGWAYDNYRAKMKENVTIKNGKPEFFLWLKVKWETFRHMVFNKSSKAAESWEYNQDLNGEKEIIVSSELVKKYVDWEATHAEIEAILNAQKTDPWFSDFLNNIND